MKISQRGDINSFLVMDVLDRANALEAEGRHILHLEAGQPGASAPQAVLDAARGSMDGYLGYTEAIGRPSLRRKIARYYRDHYNVDVAPERIIITTGSSAGFVLSFLSLFDTSAKVGMGLPYYPAYPNILKSLGYESVFLPTDAMEKYQVTAEAIATRDDLDGFMVASPANPTGAMIPEDELKKIIEVCADKNIALVSDEIYHGITYGDKAQTALTYTDNVIAINSFSKYFAMTGWRIGWLVVPESMIDVMNKLSQNLYISVPTMAQVAAETALEQTAILDGYVADYAKNRPLLLDELPKLGFNIDVPPDGAFYLYTDISAFSDDSLSFCYRMLDEIGVATTPGVDFGHGADHPHIRFSYAGQYDDIAEAIERLKGWV